MIKGLKEKIMDRIAFDYAKCLKKLNTTDERVKFGNSCNVNIRNRIYIACALRDKGYRYIEVGEVLNKSRASIYRYEKVNKIFQYYNNN